MSMYVNGQKVAPTKLVQAESKLPQVVDKTITSLTAEDLQGATSIEDYSFYYCTSLTNIEIPNGVTSIGSSVFYNCISLSSIILPNSVKNIGNSVFYGCSSLTSVTLPSTLTSIGTNTFYSCRSLTSITIPSSVTSIGINTFRDCSSLTTMTILATTPPRLTSTNAISTATTQIQVPMASVDAYKTATNWSNFADIIVGYTE